MQEDLRGTQICITASAAVISVYLKNLCKLWVCADPRLQLIEFRRYT